MEKIRVDSEGGGSLHPPPSPHFFPPSSPPSPPPSLPPFPCPSSGRGCSLTTSGLRAPPVTAKTVPSGEEGREEGREGGREGRAGSLVIEADGSTTRHYAPIHD